jgi:hypothetical protein
VNGEENIGYKKLMRAARTSFLVSEMDSAKSILFLPPSYNVIRNNCNLGNREVQKELNLVGVFTQTSKTVDLNMTFLNPFAYDSLRPYVYSDVFTINSYLNEYRSINTVYSKGRVLANEYFMLDLKDRYSDQYVMMSSMNSRVAVRQNRLAAMMLSASFYPSIPFGLYYVVTKDVALTYHTVVLDVCNLEVVRRSNYVVKSRDYDHIVESLIYNEFTRMKNL